MIQGILQIFFAFKTVCLSDSQFGFVSKSLFGYRREPWVSIKPIQKQITFISKLLCVFLQVQQFLAVSFCKPLLQEFLHRLFVFIIPETLKIFLCLLVRKKLRRQLEAEFNHYIQAKTYESAKAPKVSKRYLQAKIKTGVGFIEKEERMRLKQ